MEAAYTSSGSTKHSFVRGSFIWVLACVFYFYDYVLQVSISGMREELTEAFKISAEQFGTLSACYLYAYSIMQIPAGLYIDKFGPKKLLTAACAACAIGCLLFGISDNTIFSSFFGFELSNPLWLAKLGRLLIGGGAAFALVCCLKIVSVWFPPNLFAFFTGATVTLGFSGAVFGLSLANPVIDHFGWSWSMFYGGIFGISLMALIAMVMQDKPKCGGYQQEEKIEQLDLLEGLSVVLLNKDFWFAAIYASLLFVPITAFGGLWGTTFLQNVHGFSKEAAGNLNSLIYLGFMIGAPLSGFYSDSSGKRKPSMYIANFATFIISLFIIFTQSNSFTIWTVLLFSLGFFSSGFVVTFSTIKEINKSNVMGTSVGCMNCINSLGGAVLQVVIGIILDQLILMQLPVAEQFRYAFLSMPILLVLAFVFLLNVKETYCRQVV